MSDAGSLVQPHPRIGISRCFLREHVCLETWPRTGAHINVLQHLAGHFRDCVDVHERAAIHSDIAIPAGVTVIDCRTPDQYRGWHWPGAENQPADELLKSLADWPADRDYVLYCQRGRHSAVIAERMQQAGLRARAFRGGVERLKKHAARDA